MATYRTPDVYVEEVSLFPPSVAEVGTAIPAFVGYTQIARKDQEDLLLEPTKIYSLKEYEALFGLPNAQDITVTIKEVRSDKNKLLGYSAVSMTPADGAIPAYLLYHAVKMYFDNGGAQCYIVSVANFSAAIAAADLVAGLAELELQDEPTLLVVPDAVKLKATEYKTVMEASLKQCGELKDRFAIIDVYDGDKAAIDNVASSFRTSVGTSHLKYGAAYYPFVKTSMNFFVDISETNVKVKINSPDGAEVRADVPLTELRDGKPEVPPVAPATTPTPAVAADTAAYNTAKAAIATRFLVMPASGAVAGVYAATDATRGVWKAPANVGLVDVLEPVVKLDNLRQENLNIDVTGGKSINALRGFAGKGTLVWGARTLAGNDNEWRYVSVRRFFNMVEESVKKSTYWAVFEPNDANTWVKVRGMIENYLTDKWRDGALAGATPKDAFYVKCGLGATMTAQDILQGRINVEIGLAVVRPAEFIALKFSHKMQTS
jgi:uncharacterized protein